ncbi:oxidoreductase [Reticulibacter mediterranei]|uniref:Oxidoreductase n=1 Tax=Reticulibacter mediterranei TaxID=2778369 RepID=A0A8J3MZ97_9CHLR|nr:NADP-dependent oxidoreductase [Reticulibacter mediterranei]GHO90218.1 oxidoreductase [Reticulibacter mediterranei]
MFKQTMQAIQVHEYGDVDQLKLAVVARPEPQAGEVLVRVHAAGVNPIDWKVRQGLRKHLVPMQFPYIPGMEIAGVVEGVGPDVTTLQIEQAVYGRSTTGAYAEYAVAAERMLALKPQSLSFDEAASIPVGATTAWQGLFESGKLEKGQRVVIVGAAGGVGLFAVQLASQRGIHVIATASGANVDFVCSLGAETIIDYTTTSLANVVHDVDCVFDTVGSTLETSAQVLKRGGILVALSGQPLIERAKERGIQVVASHTQIESEMLKNIARLIDEGHLKTAIKDTFPLSQASQAHVLGQQGHGRGRIVLHIA